MLYHPVRLRTFLFSILTGLALFFAALPASAAGDEETVARNFLAFLQADKTIRAVEVLDGNRLDATLTPAVVGHLFHLSGGGYILVSPDRSISPVKAYSLAADFAALPENYRRALLAELELRVRVALAAAAVRAPLAAEPTETGKQWDFLLTFDGAARQPLAASGEFLVKTSWNQEYPYNKFLPAPAVGSQSVVAGCVNVALAQVMRYHRHPAQSVGVVAYDWTPVPPLAPLPPWPSQRLKALLYRNLNWDNMPETVNATTPDFQTDEVALLIRDIGIANRTAFDTEGSSTSLNTRMVMENYGYSTGLSGRRNGPDQAAFDAFLTTLMDEFAAERPVLLTFDFPAHMVVADGYRTDNTGNSIHINMGWGGKADNFYFLNPLPGSTIGDGEDIPKFETDAGKLSIYYKIKPCSKDGGDCAVNLEPGDAINGLAITGKFNPSKDADLYTVYKDADLYEVYLNGPTTLAAKRGYSTVGFYVSIINAADGSVVFNLSDTLEITDPPQGVPAGSPTEGLPKGKYIIRAALCDADGMTCYPLGLDQYTVTLTSGALPEEERAAIDASLEKPPVIGNAFPDLILNTASGSRKLLIDARDENDDPVTLQVTSSNKDAVTAVLNGNILDLTPTAPKFASRITVTATANGKTDEKFFTVMTDSGDTGFGRSFTIGGTFAGEQDVQIHKAILGGSCTVIGSRPGASNQAFFSYVYDGADTLLASADGASVADNESALGHSLIEYAFPQEMKNYRLKVAICKNGGCYSYKAGDTYSLAVSCPNADETTATIAGLLEISLSGSAAPGDVNGDGLVTLADAILVLQIISRLDTSAKTVRLSADVNDDKKISPVEAIFILQKTAGLRN